MKLCLPRLLLPLLLAACSLSGTATTKNGASVTPPRNAETNSSIGESSSVETMEMPKGTTIVEESIAATPTAPAVERKTTTLAADTEKKTVTHDTQVIVSPPRAPDKTVELFNARAETRKPLLYCAIAAAIAGAVMRGFLPSWPSVSNGLWLIAIILLLAWQFAEVPWWAALIVAGVVAIMVMFYKRGEWDKDDDGYIDIFQRKRIVKPTPPPIDQ